MRLPHLAITLIPAASTAVSLVVCLTMRLHWDLVTSSKLWEGEMWLKTQETELEGFLLLHSRDLPEVMFVCVSAHAQGCLSGGRGTHKNSLWLMVRTSLSLSPTN